MNSERVIHIESIDNSLSIVFTLIKGTKKVQYGIIIKMDVSYRYCDSPTAIELYSELSSKGESGVWNILEREIDKL